MKKSAATRKINLKQLDGSYAVARLDPKSDIPGWAFGDGFVNISLTDDEVSIVCRTDRIPETVKQDGPWTCFAFVGPFAFDETGIVLSVIKPLSENGVGIFLVSTFDGDHLLLKTADLDRSRSLLIAAGHSLL
jgi:hypothetical protein